MVTHPSINRAQHRTTTLIKTYALPLSQATTYRKRRSAPPYGPMRLGKNFTF